jgi:drug/metabolite transporter (DMT)-like permease
MPRATVFNGLMSIRGNTSLTQGKVTLVLVLTTIFWGGSFVFNKIGFREIPPVTFLFLRFSLATLIMGAFCVRRLPSLNRGILWKGGIIGLALGAANLAFVLGVNGTSVSRAGFLNNLFVLVIPLLSFFLWREKVDRWMMVGIFLAVAGLWQLARGGCEGFNLGDLFSTVCALFIATQIILVSRILRDEDVYLITLVQFAMVAAVGAILHIAIPGKPYRIGPVSAVALLYCAVFPTVICFTLQNTYQRYTTPSKAGLIYTLDPIWSMLGGVLFLGERLSEREWLGCALIFAAVVMPTAIKRCRERRFGISFRGEAAGAD